MKPFKIEHFSATIEDCKQRQIAGENAEEIIGFLQQQGHSVIESVRIMMEVQSISLAKSKHIVHNSKAWLERKEEFESLHDGLESSL